MKFLINVFFSQAGFNLVFDVYYKLTIKLHTCGKNEIILGFK